MRRWSLQAVIASSVLLWAAPARAQVPTSVYVFVPSADAITDGNASNQFPFDPRSVGVSTIRYQQVFSASEFAPGTYVIRQIAFRAEPLGISFVGTTGTLRIDLSTTTAAPDGLSVTFANNVGADNTTVFSGQWVISTANNGQFDLVLTLTNPFSYDPSRGNLLLDVRNYGGGSIDVLNNVFVVFDAQSTVGDSTSRVYTGQSQDGVNLTTGIADPAGSLGLVTRFTADFTPSQSPQQQVQTIINVVGALVTGGVLNSGQANGLIQPLQNALRSLQNGKTAAACSQLSDVQAGITQLVSGGVLSPEQGAALWNAAALTRATLGC